MRAFDVTAAAIALEVTPKWLDNLLSHHRIPGVVGGRQGVRRRLQPRAVLHIAVIIHLCRELGMPVRRALGTAQSLLEHGRVVAGGLELRMDVTRLGWELDARLADAAESASLRRRGRPPARERTAAAIPPAPPPP